MAKETTRVQMELPDASIERLKKLKEKTEASSYAEVTKNSYRLYEKIIDLVESGHSLCLKDSQGNIKDVELFM